MRQLTVLILLIIPVITWGQTIDEKRTIKGKVIDRQTRSIPVGTNVLQYKTPNGAVVDKDGVFEMSVPKSDTVLIAIPFCFTTYYIKYLPTDSFKKIVLGKRLKKESEKTIRQWKENL